MEICIKVYQLVTITNLFPFEVVQRCQHCQLCPLRENSKLSVINFRIRKWPLTIHGLLNPVLYRIYQSATIGGSKGEGAPGTRAPEVQILSISCSFWEKNGQIIASFRVGAPSSGESWIHHWLL